MDRENLIKLLREMSRLSYRLHKSWKGEGKQKMSTQSLSESMAFDEVIFLLTDPVYARKIWRIFFPGEVLPECLR